MTGIEDIGERLREASCVGDLDLVSKLLGNGADINSQNSMNGWTALHWACKRNHVAVVAFLREKGADSNISNKDGHIATQLTSNEEIKGMFGVSEGASVQSSKLPITPNYLANPSFPYSSRDRGDMNGFNGNKGSEDVGHGRLGTHLSNGAESELVLKARVAYCEEKDFIEIELPRQSLTFASLVDTMCTELKVEKNTVAKVRKLPDTIVRKDKDVFRFKDFQELELVLTNRAMSAASRTYNSLTPAKNNETILY